MYLDKEMEVDARVAAIPKESKAPIERAHCVSTQGIVDYHGLGQVCLISVLGFCSVRGTGAHPFAKKWELWQS